MILFNLICAETCALDGSLEKLFEEVLCRIYFYLPIFHDYYYSNLNLTDSFLDDTGTTPNCFQKRHKLTIFLSYVRGIVSIFMTKICILVI